MEQISAEHWALLHFSLVFLLTCALLVVVYALSDSSNPPVGLGLYTVYFMTALLGWIAYTLQQLADLPMPLDVPSVAAVLNSFMLFLAAGQRSGNPRGRRWLAALCLIACLSVFFLSPARIFIVQSAAACLFFAAAGLVLALRRGNVGDAIGAAGTLIMVIGIPVALYQFMVAGETKSALALVFGAHSTAFVLVGLGFLCSVLIEYQQHLSHLATEDPLTRLLNRRGMEGVLQITLAQSARQQLPTSAILVDIDRLREINTNFGQDCGDQVIRKVADFLRRVCRASDVIARTGGEEFLLVLPHTELDPARSVAERIRAAVAEHALVVNQQRIPVTVSLGVACLVGSADLDRLAGEAERALMLAKRSGANRVGSVERKPVRLSSSARA